MHEELAQCFSSFRTSVSASLFFPNHQVRNDGRQSETVRTTVYRHTVSVAVKDRFDGFLIVVAQHWFERVIEQVPNPSLAKFLFAFSSCLFTALMFF